MSNHVVSSKGTVRHIAGLTREELEAYIAKTPKGTPLYDALIERKKHMPPKK